MKITNQYREKVFAALLEVRQNFTGTNEAFARQWGINKTVFSQLQSGVKEGLLKDTLWLTIGHELGVSMRERKWNMAKTEVYRIVEEDVIFCQQFQKSKILVDDCGIGKTYTAKYLSRKLQNCFYLDASQAKGKQQFIKLFAKTLGIDFGRYADMKARIKYYLQTLENPIIIIDEAGDLEYSAFLELKEFWNATENLCGWYLIGADGLREKIRRGIEGKKVGFRELFSRYSERYTTTVPNGRADKEAFYKQLLEDVLSVNMAGDKKEMSEIVKRCLVVDENGNIGGLRRAESLLIAKQHYGS